MRGRRKRDSCKRSYGIKHQGVRHPEEIYGGLSALWYNTRRMVTHFKQVSFSSIQITHCDLDSPSATLYPTCVCTRNVEHLCTIASTQTWAGTSIVYSGLPEMHNLVWMVVVWTLAVILVPQRHTRDDLDISLLEVSVLRCGESEEQEGGSGGCFFLPEALKVSIVGGWNHNAVTPWVLEDKSPEKKAEWRGVETLPAVPCPVRGYRPCHGSEGSLLQLWLAAELTQLWTNRQALAQHWQVSRQQLAHQQAFSGKKKESTAREGETYAWWQKRCT